jgi:Glycosyl transferase family 2
MGRYKLLPCRWRRPSPFPARQGCVSPIIHPGQWGVPDHTCWMCPVIDHPDPGATGQRCDQAGTIRHLTYFVYPVSDYWRWNLQQLRSRLSLFNGRRVVAVAVGPGAASAEEVAAELLGLDVELVAVPNDTTLREMAAYPMLLEKVSGYVGPCDVTLYAHAKGVSSHQWAPAAKRWTEAMYEACCDYWPAVRRELLGACTVGIFRRRWEHAHGGRSYWHYSGSFRWVRNLDLYARPWRTIDHNWAGSETHPGIMFGMAESACLYGDFATKDIGLYHHAEWERWAEAARQKWLSEHQADRNVPQLATVILTAARQPELVHHAVHSVLGQTTDAWQLLIVDSGELAAAGAYQRYQADARISVMTTGETAALRESVGIQAWAINQAWRRGRVRGDVVCCLSDDDWYDAGWLKAVLAAAEANPDQAAWHGWAQRKTREGDGREWHHPPLKAEGVGRPGFTLRGKIDGMQVAVRRSAWVDWPEDRAIRHEADGHWMDKLACLTPIHPLAALVGVHRHTPASTFTRPMNGSA